MRIRILVAHIAVLALFVDCERMRPAVVRFTKITSGFNPKNVEYCNVSITPDDGGRSLEMVSRLLNNFTNEFYVGADFLLKSPLDGSYKPIFSYDFDVCRLWDGLMRQSIARAWFKNLKKYSNIPTTCPVYAGYYYVKKMKIFTRSVPIFLMSGKYMVNITTYGKASHKDMIASASLEVDIIKE